MTGLDELLGEEYGTPDAKLYLELAREDQQLLARLVEIRKSRMSQEDVARALGLTQATVSAFERLGNDPKLSSVRRYAKAVGAMIRHQVDPDPIHGNDSHFISHVADDGVLSTETAAARARRLSAHGSTIPWPERAVLPADDMDDEQVEIGL